MLEIVKIERINKRSFLHRRKLAMSKTLYIYIPTNNPSSLNMT